MSERRRSHFGFGEACGYRANGNRQGGGGTAKTATARDGFPVGWQIDQILKDRGAKPAQLAGPSRRAYQFLTEIKWDAVKETAEEKGPPPAAFAVDGTGAVCGADHGSACGASHANEIDEIARSLEQMSRRIEMSIAQTGVGPEQLTAQTREWRAWFAWLGERANLDQYVAAMGFARTRTGGSEPRGRTDGDGHRAVSAQPAYLQDATARRACGGSAAHRDGGV